MAPAGKIASACTEHMPLPGHRTCAEWMEPVPPPFSLLTEIVERKESSMENVTPHKLTGKARAKELRLLAKVRQEARS